MDRDLAAACSGDAVREVEPLLGHGSVNLVFRVTTARRAVVVRMSRPEDEGRALAFYDKERWCLERARCRCASVSATATCRRATRWSARRAA